MVIRVVFAATLAMASAPLSAQQLPYVLGNLTGVPDAQEAAPVRPPEPPQPLGPKIGYDLAGLVYDQTPDYLALGYHVEPLTGGVATHRAIRDYGPLDYDIEGLVRLERPDRSGGPVAASP